MACGEAFAKGIDQALYDFLRTAPRPELRFEGVVDELRLMTPVKGADANVRHADLEALAVILRAANGWAQSSERALAQTLHGG